jgi:hypothetical protein
MKTNEDDAYNVMILTLGIAAVLIPTSLLIFWYLTGNIFLSAYVVMESFIGLQNTASSYDLGLAAFATYDLGRLLPIFIAVAIVNISRILILSFILAAVMDLLDYANLESLINMGKARLLRRHVIICEYNEIAAGLIRKLKIAKIPFIVIDPHASKSIELNEKKILNIIGNPSDDSVLKAAGIMTARTIVFTSENDVENVMGGLSARRLNENLNIISRLRDENVRRKIYRVGTNMAVIPEHLAGLEMGDYLIKRFA